MSNDPLQQYPAKRLSWPGTLGMPPGLPGHIPVNRPTSSSSIPALGPRAGAPGGHPIVLRRKRFRALLELREPDVVRIVDMPPFRDISNENYDADDESDTSSDLGGAEVNPQPG